MLVIMTVLLNGCGTVAGLQSGGIGKNHWDGSGENTLAYSGVKTDVGFLLWRGEFFRLVDLPFSFVADTVLLPYTVTQDVLADDNKHK